VVVTPSVAPRSLIDRYTHVETRFRFYAKRCVLSLIENMAKHVVVMRDSFYNECLVFLDQCERECPFDPFVRCSPPHPTFARSVFFSSR